MQLRNATDAVDVCSTRPQIEAGEYHSADGTAAVINTSNRTVAYKDRFYVDIDQVGTGVKGLTVQAIVEAP